MIKKTENKLFILSILIIVGFITYSIISYTKWYNGHIKSINGTITECENNTIQEREEYCKELLSDIPDVKPDFYYTAGMIINENNRIIFVAFLIVTVPSLYYVCKVFKTRNIMYQLTRENYKEFKKKTFKKAYRSAIILPLSFLIVIIFSVIFCKGFTVNDYFFQDYFIEAERAHIISPYIYTFAILMKAFIISIIYINLSLMVARKNHKLYMSIILSYLLFIGVELFLEAFIGKIIFLNIFKIDSMILYFNIINVFAINIINGYLYTFIPLIIILIITTFIVIKLYKNKESLLIDCDKNN